MKDPARARRFSAGVLDAVLTAAAALTFAAWLGLVFLGLRLLAAAVSAGP